MSKQSSENYLDQLLNSMNVKTSRSKDKQVQALEKEIESVKQTLRKRDETSFYDELESELGDDEYRDFVSDFEAELDEPEVLEESPIKKQENQYQKEVSRKKLEEEPIETFIEEEPVEEVIEEFIPQEPMQPEKAFLQPEPELEKKNMEAEPIVEEAESISETTSEKRKPSEEALDEELEEAKPESEELLAVPELEEMSLETPVMEEIKEEEIQANESVVQDLSSLSEEELDKLLTGDGELEDMADLFSGEMEVEGLENIEGMTDFEAFAKEEMSGDLENGAEDDLGIKVPELEIELEPKKESFFDKIKKLFSKKEQGTDKVLLSADSTDVSALAEENQQILEDFAKAEGKGKKKKEKKKKEKPKKEKKSKKEKKPKQPKPKKEKKEKKPKEVDTTPPLPKKPVILICVFVFSLLALVIILTNLISYSLRVKEAKELFKKADYSAAFHEFEGLTIKEKDLEMYNQSLALAPIDSEWDAYVTFSSYDKKADALDSLVCAAGRCEVNRESAILCNAEEFLNELVEKIADELSEKYGITYEEALTIYNSFDREEYSIRMNELLQNLGIFTEE